MQCVSGAKTSTWDAKAKRPKTMKCNSKSFLPLPCVDDCMNDFQEIRVQDRMTALSAGVVPQSIAVVLFGDLISKIQPGDSVSVEGIVWQRWKALWQGKRLEIELFIEATNVERLASESPVHTAHHQITVSENREFDCFWARHRSDEWRARSDIIHAVAPWLSGLPVPKLALLLTLIGGEAVALSNSKDAPDSNRESKWGKFTKTATQLQSKHGVDMGKDDSAVCASGPDAVSEPVFVRSTPHLLLLGDPGTGKSQLLQAAQELAGRSVRTSGLGCTNAGLTCAAVRDGPDFVLEAGALVLADGGVCCIDEFSTIRSHDRAAVHEAMEQQTVSVAKAGLVCRLRSQCSVVAAQNCKGGAARGRGASYDRNASLSVNSGLPPPLLSRFDLVVVFAEGGKGAASDQDKADFILCSAATSDKTEQQSANEQRCTSLVAVDVECTTGATSWDHERLREYIASVKKNQLSESADGRADQVLSAYFCELRKNAAQAGGVGSGGVTVRTFQSLLRLAQAHARLMYHKRVTLEDAVAVVVLHRAALQDRVVGADTSADTDGLSPTLRDTTDETNACQVHLSLGDVELHHGTDITGNAVYERLEGIVLNSLGLRKCIDGRLEEGLHRRTSGSRAALADMSQRVPDRLSQATSQDLELCPTPQQVPAPLMNEAAASWSQSGHVSSQSSCTAGGPDESSQLNPTQRRRHLGSRMR